MSFECTWLQALSNNAEVVYLSHHGANVYGTPEWSYPDKLHHLYVGWYMKKRQLTVIVDGVRYHRERDSDQLGDRIASGTPEEMYAMMLDYARML